MLGVMDASSLPAFTRMFPSPLNIIHTRLHGSLCVTATWGNMVGKKHRIDMAVLAEVAKARGDPWYATGWNSVQQLNDYFQRNGSPFVCQDQNDLTREGHGVQPIFAEPTGGVVFTQGEVQERPLCTPTSRPFDWVGLQSKRNHRHLRQGQETTRPGAVGRDWDRRLAVHLVYMRESSITCIVKMCRMWGVHRHSRVTRGFGVGWPGWG